MKTTRAYYNDKGVMVPGILMERFLRKPIFYAVDPTCGWESHVISKFEQRNLFNIDPIADYSRLFNYTMPEGQRRIIQTLQDCVERKCYSTSILEESLKLILHQQSEIEKLKAKCIVNGSTDCFGRVKELAMDDVTIRRYAEVIGRALWPGICEMKNSRSSRTRLRK